VFSASGEGRKTLGPKHLLMLYRVYIPLDTTTPTFSLIVLGIFQELHAASSGER
jgi:hypothetical protein